MKPLVEPLAPLKASAPAADAAVPQREPRQSTTQLAAAIASRYAILIVLAALILVAAGETPNFFSWGNLSTLLSQNAAIAIVAVGMTFVLISGGLDVSVGATYAAGGAVYAKLALHEPLALAILIALLVGTAVGAINGMVVTRLRLNPFVTTLGTGSLFAGLVLLYSGNYPISPSNPHFGDIGTSSIASVPLPVVILGVLLLMGGVVLARTVYGRLLSLVGDNGEAGRLAGLPLNLLQASTYVIAGACAALAGVISAAQVGVGEGNVGGTVPLDAIAIVVIGGTSLFGGEGSMWRTGVGVAIYATIANLFTVNAVSSASQDLIKGGILLLALTVDGVLRKRSSTR